MENSSPINNYKFNLLGKEVIVQLQDYSEIKGFLISLDGLMNLALEKCYDLRQNKEEYLGEAFIRGNNVLSITII